MTTSASLLTYDLKSGAENLRGVRFASDNIQDIVETGDFGSIAGSWLWPVHDGYVTHTKNAAAYLKRAGVAVQSDGSVWRVITVYNASVASRRAKRAKAFVTAVPIIRILGVSYVHDGRSARGAYQVAMAKDCHIITADDETYEFGKLEDRAATLGVLAARYEAGADLTHEVWPDWSSGTNNSKMSRAWVDCDRDARGFAANWRAASRQPLEWREWCKGFPDAGDWTYDINDNEVPRTRLEGDPRAPQPFWRGGTP